MAAVTLLGAATFDTAAGTKTVTATPAVGDLIVIVVAHSGSTASVAPTDDNGSGTYTLAGSSVVKNASADTMQFWVRNALIPAGVSTVFTHAPGTTTGGGLAVLKVTGMSRVGANAVRQFAKQDNQAAATPAPAFGSAVLTANPVIGAVFNATNPAGMTARASFAELVDVGHAGPASGLEVMSRDSGETGTTMTWGNASASAFGSGVVELDASTTMEEDQGDSWWSGVQSCFIGVAIAGAAATLATTTAFAQSFHSPPDEPPVVVPAGGNGAGAGPAQRTQHQPTLVFWAQGDELPSAAPPPLTVEESVWQVSTPASTRPTDLALWDDDWVPVASTPAAFDEPGWWPATALTVTPTVLTWQGEDEVVTPATAVVAEESLWCLETPSVAPVTRLWYGEDEVVTPAAFTPDTDPWTTPWRGVPETTTVVWSMDDEIVAQPAQASGGGAGAAPSQRARSETTLVRWQVLDELPATPVAVAIEDEWSPPSAAPVAPFLRAPWADAIDEVMRLGLDEEPWAPTWVAPPSVFLRDPWADATDDILRLGLDEEAWTPTQVVAAAPFVRAPWADANDLPAAVPSVDEEGWLPTTAPVTPFVRALWADDDFVAPGAAVVDEEAWSAPNPALATLSVLNPWSDSGDSIAQVAVFGLDEEVWAGPRPVVVAPFTLSWTDVDFVGVQAGAALDDGYAPDLFRQQRQAVLTHWQVADDLPVATASVALDDSGWEPQTAARTAAFVRAPWADADDTVQRIGFDEESWTASTAASAAFVAQPWTDSGDLSAPAPTATPVEDAWQPASTQPAPVTHTPWADDVIVAQPAAAALDDGYSPDFSRPVSAVWTSALQVDDDLPQAPVQTVVDEAHPAPEFIVARQALPQQPWADDDAVPQLGVDEVHPWPEFATVRQNAVQQPWADADVALVPPTPLPVDEVHPWVGYSIARQPVVRQPWDDSDVPMAVVIEAHDTVRRNKPKRTVTLDSSGRTVYFGARVRSV